MLRAHPPLPQVHLYGRRYRKNGPVTTANKAPFSLGRPWRADRQPPRPDDPVGPAAFQGNQSFPTKLPEDRQ
jgi:hypothetical protein